MNKSFDYKATELICSQAQEVYYNSPDEVTLHDSKYDGLINDLKVHYNTNPTDKPTDSVVDRVGPISSSKFSKVTHEIPMISLDNVFSIEALRSWILKLGLGKEDIISLEFKYDGLAVELTYDNGQLFLGTTRGTGLIGDDLTDNLRMIKDIPNTIAFKGRLKVRGEVVCPLDRFAAYNATASKPLKNPRNGAAGSVRLGNNERVAERPLSFRPYGVIGGMDESIEPSRQLEELVDLGFETTSFMYTYSLDQIENLIEAINGLYEDRQTGLLNVAIDGLVIKVDSHIKRLELGETNHHPRWAIAYKFPIDLYQTKLLEVVYQVGRHGTITPVAKLEPVDIGGVTVTSATLHNADELVRLSPTIGCTVHLERAGEVIPKILECTDPTKELVVFPTHCPCCGAELEFNEDVVEVLCSNIGGCSAQTGRRLTHFVSREAFNIVGVSEGIVNQLLDCKLIEGPVDLFRLKSDQLIDLDGWKTAKVNNFLNAVEGARKPYLSAYLYSLGCPALGRSVSKWLSVEYTSLNKVRNAIENGDIIKLPKVGPKTLATLQAFFALPEVNWMITELTLQGVHYKHDEVVEVVKSKITGKSVCITGSFDNYNRNALKDTITRLGGTNVSGVSKSTDILIAGANAGSKLTKATKLGSVLIIAEADIKALTAE